MSTVDVSLNRDQISTRNCDKEPVHIPGNIQGFAAALATDPRLETLTHCSQNIAEIIGKPIDAVLGQPLSSIFDGALLHQLNNTLSLSSAKFQRERVGDYSAEDQLCEVWAHINVDGIPIIEIEPITNNQEEQSSSILVIRSLLARLQRIDNLDKALRDAAIGLRAISGFDRVMVYRFDTNGDGEIVAEDRSPHMEPFLGLRFPRWDIPNQARDILQRIPLRMIDDVHAPPVPLLSHDPQAPPLDLSFAACRGTSPIHCEYLQNIGVGSTMTLSVTVHDRLWGLFAFHNEKPNHIAPSLRGAVEVFALFFSLQMEQRAEKARNKARAIALSQEAALMDALGSASDIGDLVEDIAEPFCDLLHADGIAIVTSKGIVCRGATCSLDQIKSMSQTLFAKAKDDVIIHDTLTGFGVEDDVCAGLLAFRLGDNANDGVIFFRKEASRDVTWAGAPQKDIVDGSDGPRLKPRGSFAAYRQSVRNKCQPWNPQTLVSASEIRLALVKADASLFRRLTQKEERQRRIYIAELNHRVRNILALIRSLSRRSRETATSIEAYAEALEQRISALSAAHDLAANRVTSGVSIQKIFETEAKPFVSATRNEIHFKGEDHLIASDDAPIFALIVHELMTNCVKHGAFSSDTGHIHVAIFRDDGAIIIHWQETGGPKVETPLQHGFGIGLVEKAIPYELDGSSTVTFDPEGLNVTLRLPLARVEPLTSDHAAQQPALVEPEGDIMPDTVLVVEDSVMVAMDTSDMLQRLGVKTVETSAKVSHALSAIESIQPDFAVLDVSLRETDSFAVALALKAKSTPFCFVTGFGSDAELPSSLQSETLLAKPLEMDTLRSVINELYRSK